MKGPAVVLMPLAGVLQVISLMQVEAKVGSQYDGALVYANRSGVLQDCSSKGTIMLTDKH